MIPCMFDSAQHEILSGGEVLAWCKRETPAKERSRLFLYRHRLHNTFVIARWASDRAMGIFTDFLNLGHSLSNFNKEKADEFRKRMLAPLSPKKMARTISQSSSDFSSMKQDEDAENREIVEKRRRDE